jgi:hypothetical protein
VKVDRSYQEKDVKIAQHTHVLRMKILVAVQTRVMKTLLYYQQVFANNVKKAINQILEQ